MSDPRVANYFALYTRAQLIKLAKGLRAKIQTPELRRTLGFIDAAIALYDHPIRLVHLRIWTDSPLLIQLACGLSYTTKEKYPSYAAAPLVTCPDCRQWIAKHKERS